MGRLNKDIKFLAGLSFILLVILAGIYAFDFVQLFVSNVLSSIGIVSETAQKATVVITVFSILLFSKGFRKAIMQLFGRN